MGLASPATVRTAAELVARARTTPTAFTPAGQREHFTLVPPQARQDHLPLATSREDWKMFSPKMDLIPS